MGNLGQVVRRGGEIATRVEREALIGFIFMIVAVVFLGVLTRYTGIAAKTLWTEELARLMLLWAAFWAAGSIEKINGHFKFEVVKNLFKGKFLLFLELFLKLTLVISVGILIRWTIVYCEVVWGVRTHVLQWPEVVRAIPVLFGSLLLFTHCLIDFIRKFLAVFE